MLVSMKTEEASEKEKEMRRKTRMRELKRRSLCSATVEWKRGGLIRHGDDEKEKSCGIRRETEI